MDAVTGDWAAGIFRHLDHLVARDARFVLIDGQRFFVAECGSVTVPPGTPIPGRRERCVECHLSERFPDGEPVRARWA